MSEQANSGDAWRTLPTLTGRHVTLSPTIRADRDGILAAFATGLEGAFHTTVPNPETIEAWYDRIEREQAAGRSMPFTVRDANGEVAGVTRFLRMAQAHRRLEIGGTVYATRVQRTGLNTEAKMLLLTHAFEVLGCYCVQIRTDFPQPPVARGDRAAGRADGRGDPRPCHPERWSLSRQRALFDPRTRMGRGKAQRRCLDGSI
jgi:hypothetical protein